jgi:hypothetical protein
MPSILTFPTQIETICDACKRATHEDDLDSCAGCYARHCRRCCDAPCDCDKLALDIADRLARLRPGFFARVIGWVRRVAA